MRQLHLRKEKIMDSTHSTSVISDNEIIELYWSRDESAIKETDSKYGKYLFTVSFNIVHDNLDCEECLNDTYLGAWNSIPPARPNVLKAYLTVIIRRISVNKYNSKAKKKAVPTEMTVSLDELDGVLAEESDVYKILDSEKLSRVLNSFVGSLSDRRRFIFISRYYFAESIEAISKEIGKSKSTVNKELASIRAELLSALEREGYTV
jgi:RNA polymerase sigma-70 factor (ECF subfamily)